MTSLVGWASKNRFLAFMLVAVVVAMGIGAFLRLPIDAVPDVTNVQVQIVTRAPALSATEVERQVTQPIERAMAGTPGLKTTRSVTKLGVSVITLVFADNVDIYFARSQVNERLVNVRDTIPRNVGVPELGPIATGLGEVYMFELKPTNASARSNEELRTIVEWQLVPRLRQVHGVIEVIGFGGTLKQYQVTLDPARLAAHQVSVGQVREAIERDNRITGGGYIDQAGEQVVIRGDARFRGLEDIAATVVRTDSGGTPIRIGMLGEVDTGGALRQGAMTRDGRGEVVGASVLMLKGENSREVVKSVKQALKDLKPYLPQNVTIEHYYDRSEFIDNVLSTVGKNLGEGALIVILCLLFTLGSLRAGLLVAGAIPFSMLVGFLGLQLTGYSGNVMSLGAIDFGIIVEGAVVVIEHAVTNASHVYGKIARANAIVRAMQDVTRPAIFAVLIVILTFLPLATLEDVEGKMFRPVVYSLCFMLLGAMIYTLIFLPAVAPYVIQRNETDRETLFVRMIHRFYAPALRKVLDYPWTTLGVAVSATVILLGSGTNLGADFLPRIFEGSYAIDAVRSPSVSLPQAMDLARETELALKETPEVVTVVSRIGRPENSIDPAGPESSDVFIILKPQSQWRKGIDQDKLLAELSRRVEARVPATINGFSQPIEMRVNDLIAGAKGDVVIKIYGDEFATMSDVAEKVRRSIAKVRGAEDVKVEVPTGLPSIQVKVNRDRSSRLGVHPGDVLDVVAMSRAGVNVGEVREGERVFDLVLRLGGEAVNSAADLSRLPIVTRVGALIPLSMAADVSQERTVVQVSREQMRRRLIVQANVRGRDVVGFVKEAQAAVLAANIDKPKSIEIEWGGQFQNFNRAKDRLALLVPVALGLIGLMLIVTFRSTKYMAMTLLNLPFAAAGGVFALYVRQLPFSIPAGVGFIALSGVSVTTGIVMTTQLLLMPKNRPAKERVYKAAMSAARAPLSTALVAAVGFIPAAIATGTGAEVQRPLATVVIGGLLFSTIVSLLALPVMLFFVARGDVEMSTPIESLRPQDGPPRTPMSMRAPHSQ